MSEHRSALGDWKRLLFKVLLALLIWSQIYNIISYRYLLVAKQVI